MRQPCKNVKNKMYTGEENTPLGKGYHPSGEKIGSTMKGKNKKMYKVVKTKAGKRWQLVKKVEKKIKSPKRTKRGEKIESLPGGLTTIVSESDRIFLPGKNLFENFYMPEKIYSKGNFIPGDYIYYTAKELKGYCESYTKPGKDTANHAFFSIKVDNKYYYYVLKRKTSKEEILDEWSVNPVPTDVLNKDIEEELKEVEGGDWLLLN